MLTAYCSNINTMETGAIMSLFLDLCEPTSWAGFFLLKEEINKFIAKYGVIFGHCFFLSAVVRNYMIRFCSNESLKLKKNVPTFDNRVTSYFA